MTGVHLDEEARQTLRLIEMKYQKPQVLALEAAITSTQSHTAKSPPSLVDMWGFQSSSAYEADE
jgi:hypothetical protein